MDGNIPPYQLKDDCTSCQNKTERSTTYRAICSFPCLAEWGKEATDITYPVTQDWDIVYKRKLVPQAESDMEQTELLKTETETNEKREQKEEKSWRCDDDKKYCIFRICSETLFIRLERFFMFGSYCLSHAMREMLISSHCSRYYCHDPLCMELEKLYVDGIWALHAASPLPHSLSLSLCLDLVFRLYVLRCCLLSSYLPSITITFRLLCLWWWYAVYWMTSFCSVIIL